MDAFVYILGSFEKGKCRTYVGWTDNIDRRLTAHNDGKGARSTRGRVWFLLYAERHVDRSAAMSREARLKRDRAFRKQLTVTALGHERVRPTPSTMPSPRGAKARRKTRS